MNELAELLEDYAGDMDSFDPVLEQMILDNLDLLDFEDEVAA